MPMASIDQKSDVVEAFADRAYNPVGALASRVLRGAVLLDPARVSEQALRLALPRDAPGLPRLVDGPSCRVPYVEGNA
jgi:UPF0271 protein